MQALAVLAALLVATAQAARLPDAAAAHLDLAHLDLAEEEPVNCSPFVDVTLYGEALCPYT